MSASGRWDTLENMNISWRRIWMSAVCVVGALWYAGSPALAHHPTFSTLVIHFQPKKTDVLFELDAITLGDALRLDQDGNNIVDRDELMAGQPVVEERLAQVFELHNGAARCTPQPTEWYAVTPDKKRVQLLQVYDCPMPWQEVRVVQRLFFQEEGGHRHMARIQLGPSDIREHTFARQSPSWSVDASVLNPPDTAAASPGPAPSSQQEQGPAPMPWDLWRLVILTAAAMMAVASMVSFAKPRRALGMASLFVGLNLVGATVGAFWTPLPYGLGILLAALLLVFMGVESIMREEPPWRWAQVGALGLVDGLTTGANVHDGAPWWQASANAVMGLLPALMLAVVVWWGLSKQEGAPQQRQRQFFGAAAALVGALVFVFHVTPAQAQLKGDEHKITAMRTANPLASNLFIKAEQARLENRHADAVVSYEKVVEAFPKHALVWRRYCIAITSTNERDKALKVCKHALMLDDNAESQIAMAFAYLSMDETGWSTPKDVPLALEHTRLALAHDPNSVSAHQMLCDIGVRLSSLRLLRECSHVLEEQVPDEINTQLFIMYRALQENDPDTAQRALDRATELGLGQEMRRFLNERIVAQRPFYYWWVGSLRRVLLAWLLVMAGLALGAWLLSSRMRTLSRALSPLNKETHRASLDRLESLHGRLLWGLAVGSIVTGILGVLAVVFVLTMFAYGAITLNIMTSKEVMATAAIMILGGGFLTRQMWLRARIADPGELLPLEQYPALKQLLEGLGGGSEHAIESVFCSDGREVLITEQGSLQKQLEGERGLCLVLGRQAISALTMAQLSALLDAERRRQSTAEQPWRGFARRTLRALRQMRAAMVARRLTNAFNPRWHWQRGFTALYEVLASGAIEASGVMADLDAADKHTAVVLDEGLGALGVEGAAWRQRALRQVAQQEAPAPFSASAAELLTAAPQP